MRMGLPEKLVANKTEVFKSQLDMELGRQLGIKRCLVTLDHLQVLASSCTEAINENTSHYYCVLFPLGQ